METIDPIPLPWWQLPSERFAAWRRSVLDRWDAPVVEADDPSVRGPAWRGWDPEATQYSLTRVMESIATTEVEIEAATEPAIGVITEKLPRRWSWRRWRLWRT
ncbi:MAG TPA: hypothetical protein VGT44_15130 [Ktedonobacteraceae bacterium]|nr:hypothetical protein [Ktedonobacteraceae bacterium]